ncbi:MAG TPA: response regulator, partial [Vicinamibacterales bacterium]
MHKLLLADDSVTIQRVIELTFAGEDVQVIAVGDGEQAIARIPAERPDIVLADIGMPKRSGYEVAAFVKGHPDFKHIPVLLLAGAFEPVDDAKAEEVGCDGVLVKPFEPQHVISRVRELLNAAGGSPTRAAATTVARPVETLTRVPGPEPRVAGAQPVEESPLDDYLERLDASFASRGSKAASITVDAGDSDSGGVPTIETVLSRDAAAPDASASGQPVPPKAVPPIDLPLNKPPVALTPLPTLIAAPPVEPPDTSPTLAPAVASGSVALASALPPSRGRTLIADAFTALLALEQGEPGAKAVRLTTGPEAPVITDAMIDEVARRVLERLAPDTARAVIVEVV